MFEHSKQRRTFAAAAMQAAFVTAIKFAIRVREKEDGFSQRKLGQYFGRSRSFVGNVLARRNWRIDTISNLAEALGLRFEFAFVDRKNPRRRFTPAGVEYVQVEPSEAGTSAVVQSKPDQRALTRANG